MEKTGVFDYRSEIYTLDFRGQLTMPALVMYMLDAATSHATPRGFGFADMAKRNMLWVLSRLVIDIRDYTKLSGPIRIITWIDGVDRILTFRCFEITTQEGEVIGYARSSWAGINIDTRRPVMLDNLGIQEFRVERPCPVTFEKYALPVDEPEYAVPYTVKYSDLDVNGHFNSNKYIESIMDLFDISMYRTRSIVHFDITYISEAFYGTELVVNRKQVGDDEYIASICKEGRPICRAKVRFGGRVEGIEGI
jgi:acyl-ACP thioesterase